MSLCGVSVMIFRGGLLSFCYRIGVVRLICRRFFKPFSKHIDKVFSYVCVYPWLRMCLSHTAIKANGCFVIANIPLE